MDLGVHETIYEEEEDSSSSSSSPQSLVPWSWRHPDVVIYVQGSSFRLHKEALIARSAYFKRHLNELPEITLSPPLNITPQTFSSVADFCYGTHLPITPFNVAALRTAAQLLCMTDDNNLQQITEAYFRRVVAVDRERTSIVLRSCMPLLPEAETAAGLVSRCVAALGEDCGCLDELKSVEIGVMKVVLQSLNQMLTDSHDVLYRIIDIYLKGNIGKVSENEKIKMCNYIDCSILSPTLLMHAVQNPKMPLRFVVQAMFLQQLNTRHSIISATDHHHPHPKEDDSATTLGAILERDAALRQVSHLKSIMTNTNSRIHTLEKELSGMRKLLSESKSIKNKNIDSPRSASFRFSSETNKIERGQTGSISSLSYRDVARARGPPLFEGSSEGSPHVDKNLGRRLIKGLRNVFRLQKKSESKGSLKNNEIFRGGDGNEDLIIIKKDQAFHKDP